MNNNAFKALHLLSFGFLFGAQLAQDGFANLVITISAITLIIGLFGDALTRKRSSQKTTEPNHTIKADEK